MELGSAITEAFNSSGGCFVVDERNEVIDWSDTLAQARKVPATEALGQKCWEVRRGRSSRRPPATCRSCQLLNKQATSSGSTGNGTAACCATLSLPKGMGTALVWPPEWAWQENSAGIIQELVVLGALAVTLTPDDLQVGLDNTVELLRRACSADDCEVFLREPGGGDLLLTACCGTEREAFMSRERFPLGTGYPGIVAATEEILITPCLAEDNRFLRHEVTERGIRNYVCVPIPGACGPIGSLSMAWRRLDVPLDHAAELLSQAAIPIGTAVRAGLAGLCDRVNGVIETAGASSAARCRAFLHEIMRRSGTRSATMILAAKTRGGDAIVQSTAGAPSLCRNVLVDGVLRCPILEQGHGMMLGALRDEWPMSCRRLSPSASSPCCLPMPDGDRLGGVIVLDYDGRSPLPHNHDLVSLLAMAREGAIQLASTHRQSSTSTIEPILELRCFGGLEIQLHGEILPPEAFARKKALLLLKMLVLKAGNPISRDALIERFWPGVDPKAGANRLHGIVHVLRSAIEPHRHEKRWIYICNQGEFYYFNMESPHWIDIYAFRRHAADASRALENERTEEAVLHLEGALSLYRADLFADDPYSDWCRQERMELQNRYLEMIMLLAESCSLAGEVDRSIECLRRGLRTDPLREDIHQALIQTLADNGRRQEALQQYNECKRLLAEELGVEPLPATRRLERLLAVGTRQPVRPL